MSNFVFLSTGDGSGTWGLFLDVTAKVTVLYLLAILLHLLLGRLRPLARSGLWNALLAGLVVLPVATLAFPRLRVELPSTSASDPLESKQANDPTWKTSSSSLNPRIDDQAVTIKADQALSRSGSPGNSDAVVEPEIRSWNVRPASVVLFVYFAGCMILLIRLVGSLWMARLMKQTAVPITDPAWTARLESWRRRLRVRRRVELIESEHVKVPLAIGWFRPAIVLPPERNLALTSPQIDAVLVHELAHLQRQDDVWNLVQQVAQIFYWPHPLT
jgi:beta-lactamase regulating signal transducer with metallopeptidase domain